MLCLKRQVQPFTNRTLKSSTEGGFRRAVKVSNTMVYRRNITYSNSQLCYGTEDHCPNMIKLLPRNKLEK